jgi:hypothetical protein
MVHSLLFLLQLWKNRIHKVRSSGDNIVWVSNIDGNATEIYYYNGSTTTQLTNNNYSNGLAQISGNNVVWYSYDVNDGDTEIYYYSNRQGG